VIGDRTNDDAKNHGEDDHQHPSQVHRRIYGRELSPLDRAALSEGSKQIKIIDFAWPYVNIYYRVMAAKITVEQCRGARGMLGMSQADLADIADLGKQTIVDFERGARIPHPKNLDAIQMALEAAGVEFLPDNGVKLKAPRRSND
jgi:DNA-binding XRE family transcriptional regulator